MPVAGYEHPDHLLQTPTRIVPRPIVPDFSSEVESDLRESKREQFIASGKIAHDLINKLAAAPRGSSAKALLTPHEFKALSSATETLGLRPELIDDPQSGLVEIARRVLASDAIIASTDHEALCNVERAARDKAEETRMAHVNAQTALRVAELATVHHTNVIAERTRLLAGNPVISGDEVALSEQFDKQFPRRSRVPFEFLGSR